MEEFGDIDWRTMPRPERIERTKQLYQAIRHVATVSGATVEALIEAAYGAPQVFADDPFRNFRRGELAAPKAQTIHRFLEQNHFELARLAAPELFQINPRTAWELFLDAHHVEGGLRIVPLKSDFGIVRRDDAFRALETLYLAQRFCLELTSPVAGVAVAFQSYRGEWGSVPLGESERHLRVSVQAGKQLLPRTPAGEPIAIHEQDSPGLNSFVVIVSTDRRVPTDQRSLAQRCGDPALTVLRTEITFVPKVRS